MIDKIQLDYANFFKDNNISEDNQSDGILSDFLPKQHLTAGALSMPLTVSSEFVMVTSINKLVCKVCVVSNQT